MTAIGSLPATRREDLTTAQYWNKEWCHVQRDSRASRRRTPSLTLLLARLLDRSGRSPVDILEVGCAPGTMLFQLATLRPSHRFHGVDFSQPGLAQAECLLASRNLQAKLYRGDFREFDPEQRYGLVYSAGLIEHFTDPTEVLKHHVRLCAPSGFVAVSVPNYAGWVQHWFIHRLDPAALESHNLAIMQAEALRNAFRMAGLTDIETGCDGPGLIRSRNAKCSLGSKVLRRIAQTWNLANTLSPKLSPWRSTLWAYGRVA